MGWAQTRARIYERDEGICGVCGERVSLTYFHVDHVTPLRAGGGDEDENLRLTHPGCNLGRPRRPHYRTSQGPAHPDWPRVVVRLPVPLYGELARLADRHERSIAWVIQRLLTAATQDAAWIREALRQDPVESR